MPKDGDVDCHSNETEENEFSVTERKGNRESENETEENEFSVTERKGNRESENRNKYKETFRKIWNNITVEPLMFLHVAVYSATEPVMESLYVDKSCLVTLDKPEDICANLEDHHEDRIEVQKYSSKLEGAAAVIQNAIPLILLIYLGPLTDRYGRKAFLMWSVITEILNHVIFLLSSIFMKWSAYITLVGPFLYSLGASYSGFQTMLFICIADVTTSSNRTFRLGILKIFMNYGKPLGRLLGGQVFAAGGYIIMFGVAIILFLVCLLYIFFMKETLSEEAKKKSTSSPLGIKGVYEIPKSIVSSVIRKEGSRRNVVLLDLLIHFLMFLVVKPPYFLFSRLMFDWDATDYSNWLFFKEMASGTAMMVFVPLLIGYFKFTDSAIGMTASVSGVLLYMLIGEIVSEDLIWLMILAPLLGMWIPGAHLATRTILSKTASGAQELGKLFAAQAIVETAAAALAGPLYATVYNATVDTVPGTTFLLSAAVFTVEVYLFRICDIFVRRMEKESASLE